MKYRTKKIVKKAVGLVVMAIFISLFALQLSTACPQPLECANFTQSDKTNDCNYIVSESLSYSEQQEALCILWDQDYGFPAYQNPVYPQAQANFTFSLSAIDTSRFILFFKIVIFLLFNYALFSFLTKTSFFRKCLPVA